MLRYITLQYICPFMHANKCGTAASVGCNAELCFYCFFALEDSGANSYRLEFEDLKTAHTFSRLVSCDENFWVSEFQAAPRCCTEFDTVLFT